jgi:hypothetical protein
MLMLPVAIKVLAILGGIGLLFGGVWASFEAKKPYDTWGAVLAPLGLVIALLGVLVLCVPGFFR